LAAPSATAPNKQPLPSTDEVERTMKNAARYLYLRAEGLLDGHVVAYEDKHDLDESATETHDYLERCDAAIDELMEGK
jgi:hypothetical protein